MKADKIISIIEKQAPLKLQEEWDNSGWQIKAKNDLKKVLVALEIRSDIIDEATEKGCDLIVTHHPMAFKDELGEVNDNIVTAKHRERLSKAGISVYSSHTPFDKCDLGNNDYLGMILGFDCFAPIGCIDRDKAYDGPEEALEYVRIGFYDEALTLEQFMDRASCELGIDRKFIRYAGDTNVMISKACWCTGSGSEFMESALVDDCDLFITGDLKYHDAQKAHELGINILDLGHWGTEKIFTRAMKAVLRELKKEGLIIIESELDLNPFAF
ncbi:MAG: Nif3-like dinuclear metal center hexameric protein [Firmicutes bacterium]|nr:Nif3-like dinuclear metal center hexameric protein [Bacillota bacterium]